MKTVLVAQPCPAFCNPMDCIPAGFSVHEILQARRLEWVAMPSSRGSSQPRDRARVSYVSCIGRQVLYHLSHQGKPFVFHRSSQILRDMFWFEFWFLHQFSCLTLGEECDLSELWFPHLNHRVTVMPNARNDCVI